MKSFETGRILASCVILLAVVSAVACQSDGRIDSLEESVDALDQRLAAIEEGVGSKEEPAESMDQVLSAILDRVEPLAELARDRMRGAGYADAHTGGGPAGALDQRLAAVEGGIDFLAERLTALEQVLVGLDGSTWSPSGGDGESMRKRIAEFWGKKGEDVWGPGGDGESMRKRIAEFWGKKGEDVWGPSGDGESMRKRIAELWGKRGEDIWGPGGDGESMRKRIAEFWGKKGEDIWGPGGDGESMRKRIAEFWGKKGEDVWGPGGDGESMRKRIAEFWGKKGEDAWGPSDGGDSLRKRSAECSDGKDEASRVPDDEIGELQDAGGSAAKGDVEELLVTVGPRLLDCVGVGPRKCLEVNGELFYESIDGFDHEEGYTYRLRMERYDAFPGKKEPPADASRYGYRLIEVISKTAR